jgi:hypothetical protein
MIRKFVTVYPGHIDLGDMGQLATPANERRYSNEQLASVFEKTEAIAKKMDVLGFDTLWLAEHHFQHEGYECIPNLLMLAVHLAHVTKSLRIGCGFNIAPMWHPLRLAEDYAVADILTKGRTVFGVGRGYHTREVETFGAPMQDGDANRELFEEQVEIIFKAFNNESFSHKGKHYTLPPEVPYRGYTLKDLTLVPRPVHLPVECWQPVVSASARGLDFMVKHNIKGAVGGGVDIEAKRPDSLRAERVRIHQAVGDEPCAPVAYIRCFHYQILCDFPLQRERPLIDSRRTAGVAINQAGGTVDLARRRPEPGTVRLLVLAPHMQSRRADRHLSSRNQVDHKKVR